MCKITIFMWIQILVFRQEILILPKCVFIAENGIVPTFSLLYYC